MSRGVVRTQVVAAPAEEVWELVTDVANHVRWIPLTRIDGTGSRVGDTFTGVTGPTATRGGPGLADTMVVDRLDPPVPARGRTPAREGVAVYRKQGPVLLGAAEVRVRPLGPGHCALTWAEDVHLRGLPRAVGAPLVRLGLDPMLRLVLHRVAQELTHSATPAVAGTD